MNSNFGKYAIPPTLNKLIELQHILGDSEQFYSALNFYLTTEFYRYSVTPSDVVVFGNVGVDGIHYGFLTDYGTVTDLETAPIVCVSPMDFDGPIRIVARNLREFLGVNMIDSALLYNEFKDEIDYIEAKERWAKEAADSLIELSETDRLVQERAAKYLLEELRVPIIDNPYRYVQEVTLERQRKITIPTQDGLGVTTPLHQGEDHVPYPIPDTNLDLLDEYLKTAPVASRLALFRDIQNQYIMEDSPHIREAVIKTMIDMDLIDEAKRLSEDL